MKRKYSFQVTSNRRRLYLFWILIFNCIGVVLAQSDQVPLKEVLKSLEEIHSLSFSYKDQNVEGVLVAPPDRSMSIGQALTYLEQKTHLKFEQLSDRYIVVSKTFSQSKNYCGIVKDDRGEVLKGALVKWSNQYTVTDEFGKFVIEGVPVYTKLSVSFFGYQSKVVEVSSMDRSDCVPISLNFSITELDELVVNDFIIKGISKKLDGSFVINTDQLNVLPGLPEPDVLKSLQSLPGIQSADETVSNLNVRGGTNDQNLVLWQGIRMYQTGHFFGLISAFNPFVIKNVTVTKNGTTAALTEGTSGTIEINSDDTHPFEIKGGAGVNMLSADMFLNIPITSKSFLQVSGRRSISDLMETPTYNQYFDRAFRYSDVVSDLFNPDSARVTSDERFTFSDVSAKFMYDFNKRDRLKVNFINIQNSIKYDESALINSNPEAKTSNLDQNSLASGFHFDRRWSNKIVSSVQGYISSYRLTSNNFDVLNNQQIIQENEVTDYSAKLHTKAQLSEKMTLHWGYQFFESGISDYQNINNPRFEAITKRVLRTHALFAEADMSIHKDVGNARIGVRVNHIPKLSRNLIEPRLVFNWKLLEGLTFQLLGEFKNQTTGQVVDFQTDFLGIEKRKWALANDVDIPVATSKQLSVGWQYEKKSFLISLEGYIKSVSDITSSSQGFLNQFQFLKAVGSYESQGSDLLVNYRQENKSVWLGYSISKSDYHFPQFEPSDFPNNLDIRHNISSGFNIELSKFQLAAGANWHTGAPFTPADDVVLGRIIYAEPNILRIKNYLRVDVSAKYFFSVGKGRGQLGLSVWNIFNRNNITNYYYKLNAEGQAEQISQLALGVTPNAVLRLYFP